MFFANGVTPIPGDASLMVMTPRKTAALLGIFQQHIEKRAHAAAEITVHDDTMHVAFFPCQPRIRRPDCPGMGRHRHYFAHIEYDTSVVHEPPVRTLTKTVPIRQAVRKPVPN